MSVKIKIGNIPYIIEVIDDKISYDDDKEKNTKLSASINYLRQRIKVYEPSPEHKLRAMLFDIICVIIIEYSIRELMRDDGTFVTSAIDKLSLGLSEVLESVGITELKPKNKWFNIFKFKKKHNNDIKIKIRGKSYTIEMIDDQNEFNHRLNKEITNLMFGAIAPSKQSIIILNTLPPERKLRTTLHEILHGIITEYDIHELIDTNGVHMEFAIDQLALGMAEVLENIDITKI